MQHKSGKDYDPAAWAAQRRQAVDAANKLRMDRKTSAGEAQDQPFAPELIARRGNLQQQGDRGGAGPPLPEEIEQQSNRTPPTKGYASRATPNKVSGGQTTLDQLAADSLDHFYATETGGKGSGSGRSGNSPVQSVGGGGGLVVSGLAVAGAGVGNGKENYYRGTAGGPAVGAPLSPDALGQELRRQGTDAAPVSGGRQQQLSGGNGGTSPFLSKFGQELYQEGLGSGDTGSGYPPGRSPAPGQPDLFAQAFDGAEGGVPGQSSMSQPPPQASSGRGRGRGRRRREEWNDDTAAPDYFSGDGQLEGRSPVQVSAEIPANISPVQQPPPRGRGRGRGNGSSSGMPPPGGPAAGGPRPWGQADSGNSNAAPGAAQQNRPSWAAFDGGDMENDAGGLGGANGGLMRRAPQKPAWAMGGDGGGQPEPVNGMAYGNSNGSGSGGYGSSGGSVDEPYHGNDPGERPSAAGGGGLLERQTLRGRKASLSNLKLRMQSREASRGDGQQQPRYSQSADGIGAQQQAEQPDPRGRPFGPGGNSSNGYGNGGKGGAPGRAQSSGAALQADHSQQPQQQRPFHHQGQAPPPQQQMARNNDGSGSNDGGRPGYRQMVLPQGAPQQQQHPQQGYPPQQQQVHQQQQQQPYSRPQQQNGYPPQQQQQLQQQQQRGYPPQQQQQQQLHGGDRWDDEPPARMAPPPRGAPPQPPMQAQQQQHYHQQPPPQQPYHQRQPQQQQQQQQQQRPPQQQQQLRQAQQRQQPPPQQRQPPRTPPGPPINVDDLPVSGGNKGDKKVLICIRGKIFLFSCFARMSDTESILYASDLFFLPLFASSTAQVDYFSAMMEKAMAQGAYESGGAPPPGGRGYPAAAAPSAAYASPGAAAGPPVDDPYGEQAPPQELVECQQCGRKMTAKALSAHSKACGKVRKVFDTKKARVAGTEAAEFVLGRKAKEAEARAKAAAEAAAKKSKWKEQSSAFRDAMKSARCVFHETMMPNMLRCRHFTISECFLAILSTLEIASLTVFSLLRAGRSRLPSPPVGPCPKLSPRPQTRPSCSAPTVRGASTSKRPSATFPSATTSKPSRRR